MDGGKERSKHKEMLVRKGEFYLDKDSKTLLRSVFLGGWSFNHLRPGESGQGDLRMNRGNRRGICMA